MAFHISKIANFGTTEPWVARLWFGMLKFRNLVYLGNDRLAFDEKYGPVIDNLHECYRAMLLLHKTIAEHEAKILSQEIQNPNIIVTENIDTTMSEALTSFFIKGDIAIKHLVRLSKFMGCSISFVRHKEDTDFEHEASRIPVRSPFVKPLVELLRKHRAVWFLRFRDYRDQIEHGPYNKLAVKYVLESNKVRPQFPTIGDMELVDGTQKLWELLFTFVEDVLILLFRLKLPPQILIGIVPKGERDPQMPLKYVIGGLDLSAIQEEKK